MVEVNLLVKAFAVQTVVEEGSAATNWGGRTASQYAKVAVTVKFAVSSDKFRQFNNNFEISKTEH